MKETKTVQAHRITLLVDDGWFEMIAKATSYWESNEVCIWENTEGPFEVKVAECSECGYQWEDSDWIEGSRCPTGCDDE